LPIPLAAEIWDAKYRLKSQDGAPVDANIADTWHRVAVAAAAAEPAARREAAAAHFYGALENFTFIPAGRILAGAGSGRAV